MRFQNVSLYEVKAKERKKGKKKNYEVKKEFGHFYVTLIFSF